MYWKTGLARSTALLVVLVAASVWAAQGRTLKVTVNYTGEGEVGDNNLVFLSLWDTPDMQAAAPIAGQSAAANGSVVSFENVTASPVYLTALYSGQGGWTGTTAPPSGTTVGIYGGEASGAPTGIEIADGQTVEVEFSFNDAFKIP